MIAESSTVAEAVGTPAYVYELAEVRRAHAGLRAALPRPHRLYYSLKANPHPVVAGELARLGCWAEVSSVGELDAAIAAGFAPDEVLLTGPGKTPSDVFAALMAGVRRFSAESPADLARIAAACRQTGGHGRCLLRINADTPVPGMGLAMTGKSSQFGADLSWVLERPEEFNRHDGVELVGLHLYMGTNIEDENDLLGQYERSIETALLAAGALGVDLAELDLGGGFAAPYAEPGALPTYPALGARLSRLLDESLPGWREGRPVVSFESGRHLVGSSGRLLTRVLDVKRSKGRTFAILDSGIHHLGGMSGLRRLPRLRPRPVVAGAGGAAERYTLAGPLCTPLDSWAVDLALPELRAGDLLEVPNVGAYGLSASLLAFLSHPAPVEVVLDRGTPISTSHLSLHRTELADRRTAASHV